LILSDEFFFLDYSIGNYENHSGILMKELQQFKKSRSLDSTLAITKLRLSVQGTSENIITETSKVQKLHLTKNSY